MSYRDEAIKYLAKELSFPTVDGVVPESIIKQYESTIAIYEMILSKTPVFPITIWSAGFNYIKDGAEFDGMPGHPGSFNQLSMDLAATWRGFTGEVSENVKIITPPRIVDANNLQIYP